MDVLVGNSGRRAEGGSPVCACLSARRLFDATCRIYTNCMNNALLLSKFEECLQTHVNLTQSLPAQHSQLHAR